MNDQEVRTLWCGNLSDKVTEEILYELFLQAAPLEEVRIPTDKSGRKANYGFVVVKHEVSVDYVVQLLDGTSLYDRCITIKPRKHNQRVQQQESGLDELEELGALLNAPFNAKASHHRNDRPHYNKPYHRHDNYSGRHNNWNNRSHDRNRRRYY